MRSLQYRLTDGRTVTNWYDAIISGQGYQAVMINIDEPIKVNAEMRIKRATKIAENKG